jgi:transcription initiation factor TFIID subunit 8
MDGSASKRKCVESSLPQSSQRDEVPLPNLPTRALFDDDPRRLLLRAVALALEHVGFDGASPEAMEAMCSEVDTCQYPYLFAAEQFLTSSRRHAFPFPGDLVHAER